MSHHLDTKLAKEEPSLNVCDLYLFEGSPGTQIVEVFLTIPKNHWSELRENLGSPFQITHSRNMVH